MTESSTLERACLAWDSALSVEPVPVPVFCRSGLSVGEAGTTPRIAYVSVGSPIEQLLGEGTAILDREHVDLDLRGLTQRLVDGEVAAVLAPPGPVSPKRQPLGLSDEFVGRRQKVRADNVLMRFLLRQIGLAEVSSHRGAPAELYRQAQELWSLDLALCTDPGMLLTLGADRQRYVDGDYEARATDRLPRALGRLRDLGVQSYPRLVIV